MTTIDLDKLADVNGGVRDAGDGRGCIPGPFSFPRPPSKPQPGESDIERGPILGGRPIIAQ